MFPTWWNAARFCWIHPSGKEHWENVCEGEGPFKKKYIGRWLDKPPVNHNQNGPSSSVQFFSVFRLSSRCGTILANLFSSSHSFTIASYCSLASSGIFKDDLQQSLPPSVTANRKLICGTELRPTRKVQTGAFLRCMSRKWELSSLRSSCTSRWFEKNARFWIFC